MMLLLSSREEEGEGKTNVVIPSSLHSYSFHIFFRTINRTIRNLIIRRQQTTE